MVNDYAIEVKEFPKEQQKFVVSFDGYYSSYEFSPSSRRRIVICSVIENPSKKIYAGSAIKNPNDLIFDEFIGRRLALKRAILVLWMIWAELGRTDMPFKPFWQLFRKALSERKGQISENY